MKSRAAIAWEPGQRLQIEELDVQAPQSGEVLVKMTAASVCHMDALALSGRLKDPRFPCVLGHEGAGVVVDVGPDVKHLLADDHVIPLFMPECGHCLYCTSGRSNLCQALEQSQPLGVMPDGTTRFSHKGEPVYSFLGTSTLSEYIVVPEIALARVNHKADLMQMCLLGCTVTTGIGAVLNTARVEPGSTVAVFGLGGIGLSAIQGAVMAQASRIIGVDTNIDRFNLAKDLGATDCLNPRDYEDPIEQIIMDMTQGGVDYAFECIGLSQTMQSSLACTHAGWGRCVVVGCAAQDDVIEMHPDILSCGRTWQGAPFGGVKGRSQLPEIAEQCISGEIKIDDLITHRLKLEDANLAFDLLQSGQSIRSVIAF